MVFFNYALRKLNAKIVYYGPGLCGKTTNLQWIHDHFEGGQRGKMISLATEGDRTIFFDLLPIDIGTIRGMDVTLQLYTVPGQVHYNSTRQLVLRGADGVVFVADSQRTMRASNVESFENLQENLMLQGIDLKTFPHVLQFNKRDLRDLLTTEDLNENLNVFSVPIFEAIATEGIGVQETLEGIVKLVMRNLREKYEPVANASAPGPAPMNVQGPTAFQPGAGTPAVAPPMPMPPAGAEKGDPPAPPASAEPPGPGAPFAAPPVGRSPDEETQELEHGPGLPELQDEDEIRTKVYDGDETEVSTEEPAAPEPTFDPDEVDFARTDEPTKPDARVDEDGLFTDPRDEDGTGDRPIELPPASEFVPPETDAKPRTDPEILVETPEPEPTSEGMEDLFEADEASPEPPAQVIMPGPAGDDDFAFGSFDDDEGKPSDEIETINASIDDVPPTQVAAPETEGRFEDRIDAPGPFAPKAPPEAREDADQADRHEIPAEIMQALGASEDREALASLSTDDGVSFEMVDEVQPVVPPPPEPADEPAPPAAPTPPEPEPADAADEASVVDQAPAEPVEAAREQLPPFPGDDPLAKSQPIVVGTGDPFADDDDGPPSGAQPEVSVVPAGTGVNVTAAGDNQLHLQLKGSGAIAEMGQVRALDIEVPVPGQWVGNRKVTLQLRLTLTPAEEDND